MPLNFDLVDTNPNDTTGGGGSLAGPTKDADAHGPYFVWPNQEFESYASPHAVVAASEVRAMAEALAAYERGERDAVAGGEKEPDHAALAAPAAAVTGQFGDGEHPGAHEFDFNNPDDFTRAFSHEAE